MLAAASCSTVDRLHPALLRLQVVVVQWQVYPQLGEPQLGEPWPVWP